jgi:hypothetical protein
MKHEALTRMLHGGPEAQVEQTPEVVAGSAVRDSLANVTAAEGQHASDSPEVVGARAHLDRALEVWREAKENVPAPPDPDFEGGARPLPPPGPPSHEATVLALIQVKADRVDGLARHIDRQSERGSPDGR